MGVQGVEGNGGDVERHDNIAVSDSADGTTTLHVSVSPCLRVSVSPCLRVSVSPCLRVSESPFLLFSFSASDHGSD